MSVPSRASSRRTSPLAVVLRLLGAAALAVSAWLHYALTSGPLYSDGQITLAGMFVAQAVVATVVALWVLALGDRLSWLAVLVVGLSSLAALVLSVYVQVPAFGPFPTLYEPAWYPEKVYAAVAAGVAALVAAVALPRVLRR